MWWLKKRSAADFSDEVQAHLALESERLRAEGWSEQDAPSEARRAFGNVRLSEERFFESSRLMWLEHLRQDVLYGWRQMVHNKAFTAIAVGTLALGIGSAATVFSMVQATLLRPLPYGDGDRLMSIQDRRVVGQSTGGLVSVPRFFDLAARNRTFKSLTFFYSDEPTVRSGMAAPVALDSVGVGRKFWETFGIAPVIGRTFTDADNAKNAPLTAVISYRAWQDVFSGDPAILRRQVRIDGKGATIVGVLARGVGYPNGVDMWTPAQFDPADWKWYRGDGTRFVKVFGRVKNGVSIGQAAEELQGIGEQLRREHPQDDWFWAFASQPMREYLYGSVRPALLMLLGASGLLLGIACLNVANLLLSRGTTRVREVALRRALGASRGRLVMQFLMESALLSLMGGATGLAFAWAAIRLASEHLPGQLVAAGAAMNWPVILFAFALAVTTGILCGMVPAFASGRTDLNTRLKVGEARMAGAGGSGLRYAFVSIEVALSLVLLIGSCLLGQSFWRLVNSPLGFRTDHVLTFSVKLPWNENPKVADRFFRELQRRMDAVPGVSGMGRISALPTADWHWRKSFDVDWRARTEHGDAVNVEGRSIAGNYLSVMSIPLLAGRALRDEDARQKTATVVVNEEFVRRFLPGQSVVGRHLINGKDQFEIVGVIGNVRGTAGSISAQVGPEVYFAGPGDVGGTFVVASQLPIDQLARAIGTQVRAIDPTQAVRNLSTLDRHLSEAVAQPRFDMGLLAGFAGIALLLACVGIYGVVSYAVAQRSVEIGIRMALGATRARISSLFLRRALTAALIGLTLGGVSAIWLTRLLESQLYGVSARNPLTFLGAAGLLLIPVLLATLVPCLRAASVNPVEALRKE